jgi:hypothetical protein
MILFHNLEFFDKAGNNLNLLRTKRVNVTVEDRVLNPDVTPHGSGAIIDAVTNYKGQLESFIIYNGGLGYTENTAIVVIDDNGTSYTILGSNFVIRDINGTIVSIIIPSQKTGFSYPVHVYTGDMFFNEISVGLLESEHIYVAEKTLSTLGNEMHVYPRYSAFSDGTLTENILVKVDGDDPEIFLYDVIDKTEKHPFIEKYDEFNIAITDGLSDTLNSSMTRVLIPTSNSVLQVNVAVRAEEEGIYEKILRFEVVYDDIAYSFAEILFRAEVVGEDERLKIMLDTFGFSLTSDEVKIFRDSDINEELPNYNLLNEKRKEMLLEHHNILPYIGSYKALANILKYFDYADLRIKEYWLNTELAQRDETIPHLVKGEVLTPRSPVVLPQKPVFIKSMVDFLNKFRYIPNYGLNRPMRFEEKRYKQVDIPFELKDKGRNWQDEDFLPSSIWKKTSLFSLHYDINKVTDEIDSDGLPVVEDSFMFSEEEALIKLFALKTYLKEKFLPLNARIIDIVGEGVYFARFALNSWSDGTNTTYIDKEFQPGFEIKSSFLIEDLHDYGTKVDSPDSTVPILTYYPNTMFNFMNTDSIAKNNTGPVGCKLNLVCDIFDLTWDECNTSWDELITSPLNNVPNGINTWDTIGQREYYELEWRIKYEIPSKFSWSLRKKVLEGKDITVAVPFAGKYNVELILYDMTNHSVKTNKYIDVIMPEVEVTMLSRFLQHIETWDDCLNNNVTWDNIGGDWRGPGYQNNVTWDDCQLTWDDLDIRNHNLEEPNKQFPANQTSNVIRISEADRFVGNIISIDKVNLSVKCNGQFTQPKLRDSNMFGILDYVFFRRDNFIFKTGVISADYSIPEHTTVYVESLPAEINTSFKCLREIGNTVLVQNNVLYDEVLNPNGLKPDTYIKMKYDEIDVPNIKRMPIINLYDPNSILQTEDDIQGISVSSSIQKIANEFGKIYKVRNISSIGSGASFEFIAPKIIKLYYTPEVDEIIPGFTIMTMTSLYNGSPYTQRLLVQHWDTVGNELTIKELDGDSSLNINAVIEFEYWQFNTKLVHFETGIDTNILMNFNDYPYHYQFIQNTGTPSQYSINGNWFFDYVTKDGDYSLYISNLGFEGNNTLITVSDSNSELYRVGPSFKLSWSNFDEDYAEKRVGVDIFSWDNMHGVTWDELYHLQWKHLEYNPGCACGFEITKISPNGSIKFNELPEFIFNIPFVGSGSPPVTLLDQFNEAVNELNSTDNPGMQLFNFSLITISTTPEEYKIVAIAKTNSISALGYLKFDNGVEGSFDDPTVGHTYPLGNYINWNSPYIYGLENLYANWLPVARTYYEYGYDTFMRRGWYPAVQYTLINGVYESKIFAPKKVSFLSLDPEDPNDPIYTSFPSLLNSVEWRTAEGMRNLYDSAIAGPFTWDDLFVSIKPAKLKKFTTVFFILSNCKIAGKNKFKWSLKDRNSGDIICETIKNELIWTFSYNSIYDLTVTIEDINGNSKSITKNAFITISN